MANIGRKHHVDNREDVTNGHHCVPQRPLSGCIEDAEGPGSVAFNRKRLSADDRYMETMMPRSRSELMRRIRVRDTGPEMVVRRFLHARGYRFRVGRKDLPGRPDIVLPKWQTVVFVHGCFWHGCGKCDRGLRVPKTNRAFWTDKIAANRRRDQRVARELRHSGWRVITVWECQTKSERTLQRKLKTFLGLCDLGA